MTKEAIMAALKMIIKPYSEETTVLETLSENTDFIKDLKINSANLVDIVLDVEEKFGIEIDNDSMAKMLNVQATIDVIQSKLGNNAGE